MWFGSARCAADEGKPANFMSPRLSTIRSGGPFRVSLPNEGRQFQTFERQLEMNKLLAALIAAAFATAGAFAADAKKEEKKAEAPAAAASGAKKEAAKKEEKKEAKKEEAKK
jgi:hypothetical protein